MSNPADRVEDETLQLSIARMARLPGRLLESLDEEAVGDPEAVSRAWELEIERRVSMYRAGLKSDDLSGRVGARVRCAKGNCPLHTEPRSDRAG